MKRLSTLLTGAAMLAPLALPFFTASQAEAHLLFQGQVTIGGTGLGAVNTILTFTSAGSGTNESGVVSWNGSADVTHEDPTGAQLDAVTTPDGRPPNILAGTADLTGRYTAQNSTQMENSPSHNKTITLGSTGWQHNDGLMIVFNPNEPQNNNGNPAVNNITLNELVMTIYSAAGDALFSAPYTPPAGGLLLVANDAGTGNSGFGFKLDAAETTAMNALAGVNVDSHIGLFAYATDATGGQETFFGTVVACTGDTCHDPSVPEPIGLSLLGVGLLGLGTVKYGSKLIS